MLGYGWAGIFRKFLVDSPYMWWPANLVQVSLFWALHDGATRPKGGLTRLQFFIVVLVSSFSYYIVPNYLFPSITALSFICWIWKKSVTAQQIGSGLRGLGIGSFALDWSTVAVSYGLSFATLAATLSHVALFYGRTIWQQTKVSFQDKIGDVHTRLMKKNYDVVPQWWFYTILMLVVGLSMLAFEGFGRQLQLPYWGVLSMLAFKCFGTIVASSVYFGTAWWLLSTVQNICDPSKLPQGSPWTCPGDDVFYNASVIWRVVGPPRMFGSLGTIACLVTVSEVSREKMDKIDNMPILIGGAGGLPLVKAVNYRCWLAVGIVFNFVVYRRYKGWWVSRAGPEV
ncbi:hypothetical protein ACSBR2_015159 [Camellia fascicularis]